MSLVVIIMTIGYVTFTRYILHCKRNIYSTLFLKLVVGHTTKHDTQSFVGRENMTTRGWKCHTRAQPKCDIFNVWSSYIHVPLTTVRHLLNVLWPLYRSTCVSQHLQLRSGRFVGTKFYCPHALADGNQSMWIREKTLEVSSTVLSTLSPHTANHKGLFYGQQAQISKLGW